MGRLRQGVEACCCSTTVAGAWRRGRCRVGVDISETPKDLTPARLAQYQVLVLNNANALTDLLDGKERQAVESWYKKGRGLQGKRIMNAISVATTRSCVTRYP
jgi:hypothetical protein